MLLYDTTLFLFFSFAAADELIRNLNRSIKDLKTQLEDLRNKLASLRHAILLFSEFRLVKLYCSIKNSLLKHMLHLLQGC